MECVKRSLFQDSVPEAISNNLSDAQLYLYGDQDGIEQADLHILENLIFPNKETSYNALDDQTGRAVLDALRESYLENSAGSSVSIQCTHCNEIFTNEDFQNHVCQYDENQQLISIQLKKEDENEFQKFIRCSLELLQKNQSLIADLISNGKSKPAGVSCTKCCRKFVNEKGLSRHYSKHVGELLEESPLEVTDVMSAVTLCLVCGAVFEETSEAWEHLLSNHIEVKEAVDYLKIPTSLVLSKNEDSSTAETSSNENMIYFHENAVQAFTKTIFVSKVYQCEFCDLVFVNSKMVLYHGAKHDPRYGFTCNKCELKDFSIKDILLHRRDECINFHDVRKRFRDFPRVWVCNTCEDSSFRGLEQLLMHRYDAFHFFPRIETRSNKLLFSCERCNVVFKTATELVDHYNEKHQKKERAETVGSTSERIERSPNRAHRGGIHQTSSRPRLYLCEVCGKSYTQSSHLWQHLRFHQGVKPFGCTVEGCTRRFTIRPDLNDHVRKCHTGERPYLCTICDKRFLTGSVYYQHRLIHRGERRYGCEECGKRFYRADALKNHLRIHTGEKPHACYECGKKFRQRGDRDKHVKARHPDAVIISSPKKERIKSFGRGRIKNNTSLYCSMPPQSNV